MANFVYAKGKEALLSGGINIPSDTIKVALVTSAYTPNSASDQYYTSISAAVVGTPVALASKTVTSGVLDAADATFTAVTSGSTCSAVVIYKDTGLAATSALLAYIDTISGFPLATSGGDIVVQWDNGANKIFAL